MLLIYNDKTDPYFNLASEQYLLESFTEPIIMLWRNDRAVIVGRNQNAVEEINREYVREHNIKVVRRLTGGGAVFHDLGNINYTIIQPYDRTAFCDYAFFTKPICDFLQSLGVNAFLSGRNDLHIDGSKFSGNAQTLYGDRHMHHGTLMFQADIEQMSQALNPNPLRLQSKGIKSVSSRVTNISSHLNHSVTTERFLADLYTYLKNSRNDITEYAFSERDHQMIQKLADEKYSTWEWNFGKSPEYSLRGHQLFPFGLVDVRLLVKDGVISSAAIFGDFFGSREIAELEKTLVGLRHTRKDILEALSLIHINEYIVGISEEQFCKLIL